MTHVIFSRYELPFTKWFSVCALRGRPNGACPWNSQWYPASPLGLGLWRWVLAAVPPALDSSTPAYYDKDSPSRYFFCEWVAGCHAGGCLVASYHLTSSLNWTVQVLKVISYLLCLGNKLERAERSRGICVRTRGEGTVSCLSLSLGPATSP